MAKIIVTNIYAIAKFVGENIRKIQITEYLRELFKWIASLTMAL
ncbi:hypothetical protein [Planctobacterium marinum]